MNRLIKYKIFGLNLLFVLLFAAFALTAYFNPWIDLKVSGLFYDNVSGFHLEKNLFAQIIHKGTYAAATLVVVFYFVYLIISAIKRNNKLWGINRKSIIYLLLVIALGPGLLINVVLKDYYGRARPFNVTQFGGTEEFTPAFHVVKDAVKGFDRASFPSGHSSFGFYWLSLGFVCTAAFRKWLLTGLGIGFFIGFIRIIQGGHYLSDVIFAFFIVYAVAAVCDSIMRMRIVETPDNKA